MTYVFVNTSKCRTLVLGNSNVSNVAIRGIQGNISQTEATFLIIGFGIFAAILAVAFSRIRKNIYGDKVGIFLLDHCALYSTKRETQKCLLTFENRKIEEQLKFKVRKITTNSGKKYWFPQVNI